MSLFWAFRKNNLDISVEWNPLLTERLEKKLISIHMRSFMDAYKDLTGADLGLCGRLTKKAWLTSMIEQELIELKKGMICYAGIYVDNELLGFVTCDAVKPRYSLEETKKNQNFKNDVYIRLLAMKPNKYLLSHYNPEKFVKYPESIKEKCLAHRLPDNIRIGLGSIIMESIERKFIANSLTLDTRRSNFAACRFYEKLGFKSEVGRNFSTVNPEYYVGYEKKVSSKFKL